MRHANEEDEKRIQGGARHLFHTYAIETYSIDVLNRIKSSLYKEVMLIGSVFNYLSSFRSCN